MTMWSPVLVERHQAANDRQLVGDRGLLRHQLADFHAGDIRLDRIELTADLGRRPRLEIVGIQMRRTPGR